MASDRLGSGQYCTVLLNCAATASVDKTSWTASVPSQVHGHDQQVLDENYKPKWGDMQGLWTGSTYRVANENAVGDIAGASRLRETTAGVGCHIVFEGALVHNALNGVVEQPRASLAVVAGEPV